MSLILPADQSVRQPPLLRSRADVRSECARLIAAPKPLERPVLVLSGWRSPRWQASGLARRLAALTSGRRIDFVPVSYLSLSSIERAAGRALRAAEACGATEVDVVGVSMGGLVARAAAAGLASGPSKPPARLRIRRLFTLATPHRGARLAELVRPDAAARSMRPGSEWLSRLDALASECPHEIIPYARTGDAWVGATRTAPPGSHPIWTPGPGFLNHFTIARDPLIALDIALRLRGEASLATQPSPPPGD